MGGLCRVSVGWEGRSDQVDWVGRHTTETGSIESYRTESKVFGMLFCCRVICTTSGEVLLAEAGHAFTPGQQVRGVSTPH